MILGHSVRVGIVLRMTLGEFRKEHGHGEGNHLGQNQGVERAIVRAEGGECRRVLAHDSGADLRAHPARGTATPGIVDASEAGLIPGTSSARAALPPGRPQPWREVFFESLLPRLVGLRVTWGRRQFAPDVPGQHPIHRGFRHDVPHRLFIGLFHPADFQ